MNTRSNKKKPAPSTVRGAREFPPVVIRLSESLVRKLDQRANANYRSRSAEVRLILTQALEAS